MPLPFDIRDPAWMAPRYGMNSRIVKNRVVLVRHGESSQNRDFVMTGVGESATGKPELTEMGVAQAKEVADYLSHASFSAVEVSPLSRAIETAAPFVAQLDPSLVRVKFDLRERRFGESLVIQKLPVGWDLISDDPELVDPATWIRPNESMSEFKARVEALKDRWRRTGSPQERRQTLVFAHSLLISQLIGDIETGPFFHVANGSITVIDFADDGSMHVHMVNKTDHLSHPTGHHTPFTNERE